MVAAPPAAAPLRCMQSCDCCCSAAVPRPVCLYTAVRCAHDLASIARNFPGIFLCSYLLCLQRTRELWLAGSAPGKVSQDDIIML